MTINKHEWNKNNIEYDCADNLYELSFTMAIEIKICPTKLIANAKCSRKSDGWPKKLNRAKPIASKPQIVNDPGLLKMSKSKK